jgi:hypothetical protein
MATTANIEKVVRKVLDDELSESRQATLKAIKQVTRLLTQQVIPHLPDRDDQQDEEPEGDTPGRGGRGNGGARAFSAMAAKPGADPSDDTETPDDGEDEPAHEVPTAVTEAMQAVYGSLSADQAQALAAVFTAISEEPGSNDESDWEQDQDEEQAA